MSSAVSSLNKTGSVGQQIMSFVIWNRMSICAAILFAAVAVTTLFFQPLTTWTLVILSIGVIGLSVVLIASRLEIMKLRGRCQQLGCDDPQPLTPGNTGSSDNRLIIVNAKSFASMQERERRYRMLAENAVQQAQIEHERQRTKKMESLGTMAGSIAHNFNNLLLVVSGNLELAKADLPESSTAAVNIQRALNASQRAADLSNMMLTYVGQLKKESVPVDLSHVVQTVLESMDESKMAHVTLDLDLADPMPLVAADVDQMQQMLSGLITNAIEALGNENGRVRISTGSMHCDKTYLSDTYLKEEMPEGMYAYAEVVDSGCGMDAETLGKVFDPFFSSKFTGRGLGLAAVMGIIRSHNGTVKVSSVKNEGSVFTALFPIQGISLRQDVPVRMRPEANADGKTVLLVDDESMVMDIGSQFLGRLGYHVRMASSGPEALAIFRHAADRIDCLLLDFTMPGMNGLETMLEIRKIRPDAKVIITSGYTRQQIEDRFARIDPPQGFIHKPFEMKALQEILNRILSTAD